MNPHVIVVHEYVFTRSADLLQQLCGKVSDLRAVASGVNSLLDSFFLF